jgi:hypothetical protein
VRIPPIPPTVRFRGARHFQTLAPIGHLSLRALPGSLPANRHLSLVSKTGISPYGQFSVFSSMLEVAKKWLCARSSSKSRYISPKSRELNDSFHIEIRLFRLNFRLILILVENIGKKGSNSGESRLHRRIRLIRLRRHFFGRAG